MSHVVSDGRTYVTHLYPKRFVCLSLWPFYLAVASGCCRWLLIDSSGFIDSSGSAVQHLRRAIMTSRHVSLQGKFYRYKTPNHPHTNMAKAALNMMTRTSAAELAASHRIFMTAVDTGWINDENPRDRAARTAELNHFQTPIDEVDAAARVLQPVFEGVATGKPAFGVFLKDYKETEW